MSSADEDIKTAASAEADGKRMASTTAEDMEAPSAEDGEREKMSAADQIEYVPAYMAEENPPIVEFADPRNTIMRLLCCHPVVCAWQGCDKPMHNWLTCFCCCFFTLCCWKPGPRQKKFKPLGQEKKVCCSCCECHPEALCHRLLVYPFWISSVGHLRCFLLGATTAAKGVGRHHDEADGRETSGRELRDRQDT
eukprot:g15934.t1